MTMVDSHIDVGPHLQSVLVATGDVLSGLQLLGSCRFGPSELINAAVADLAEAMSSLDALGPNGGHPSLASFEGDADAAVLGMIRMNVGRIREESSQLSLELRRLLADAREVMSIATGSAGTYDSLGRTTSGLLRRGRGAL